MAIKTAGGVSAETAGASALALSLLPVSPADPPGMHGPHLHERHETALYVQEGRLVVRHGDWLQEETVVDAGEFLFLPAGEVHALGCADGQPCRVVVASSNPSAQDATQPLPELTPLLRAA
ncbi:MAG TPA: cupin domain-containing protein [Chloroflexota bacterium]|nr:cupin domain-containing protein [Chloroflexota bacterium]